MVAVVLSAVAIGYTYGVSSVPPVPVAPVPTEPLNQIEQTPEPQEILIDGYIAVPGFERLRAEGSVIQSPGISNPSKNDCYFIVSIIMPDGQEIFNSPILAPGQSVDVIELPNFVNPGVYEETIARYSCYSLDEMKPLNGADIKFILEVLP